MAEAMFAYGMTPPNQIVFDGEIHRFGKKKSCWYVAHLHPVPVCIYGDWKLGITSKYAHSSAHTLRPTKLLQLQKTIKALQEKQRLGREQQYKEAKAKAQNLWNEANPAIFHEYLRQKCVLPLGIRVDQKNNLLVPLSDGKDIHSLQFIQPDSTKRFLKGGKTKGMFYQIKPIKGPDKLLICEGYATGATLYMDIKLPVVVAFSANNLVPVAKAIRRQYPKAEILICGDNDHATIVNAGKQAAIDAAIACNGKWIIPDFTGFNPSPKDTDFNDLYRLQNAGVL